MVSNDFYEFVKRNSIKHFSPVKTSSLVSFRVGAIGEMAVVPACKCELIQVLKELKNSKLVILGNGTNCFFTDGIFDGVIILTNDLNGIRVENNMIVADCGVSVNTLCRFALENELSGLEFAYGIPGSVGGGVYMNASAFGGCFADVVFSSCVFDYANGVFREISHQDHCFGVKKSIFQSMPFCLLSTKFELKKDNKNNIKAKMDEYRAKRVASQPLDLPSAGSVFLKPEKSHASYLIDKAGLKGYKIGGAMVSEKHAGFIVNCGGASANDVLNLIDYIKKVVYNKFSIKIEEEIIYLE